MACKHAIVTNQKSALPPGTKVPPEDMQICCICGQLRSQQWGPWHEPIDVKERTMSTECYTGKTEKQVTPSSDWYPDDHGQIEKQREGA